MKLYRWYYTDNSKKWVIDTLAMDEPEARKNIGNMVADGPERHLIIEAIKMQPEIHKDGEVIISNNGLNLLL